MSTHIAAASGEIAETVLLPGDPLRAEWIAKTYLDDVTCYSQVRNMLGFTGTYRGQRISVQGTGMGQPSISIYVHELLAEYGVMAVEMEAAALYTLAAKFGARAMAVCTVSDNLVTGEETSAEERERTFAEMVELALDSVSS